MATRLIIYNGALRELGERSLASLSEDREPRRILDEVWNDGLVDHCLGVGQWRFATRSVELEASAGVKPSFGYANAFVKPTDHIRTTGLCNDEYFNSPLLHYSYEAGYYYADIDPIYLRYVSNNADYGGNLADWPANFSKYVELYAASLIVTRLTGAKVDAATIAKSLRKRLLEATSTDAMESPTQFPPAGSWVSSRVGGRGRDNGSRGRLIG